MQAAVRHLDRGTPLGGSAGPLARGVAEWVLEIVSRPPGSTVFALLKRRIVERTIGRLKLARRLSKDCEILPASRVSFIRLP